MTSIEWLIEKHFGSIAGCTPDFRNKIKQAKEMHKQEISRAYFSGWDEELDRSGEQYYNETYNK